MLIMAIIGALSPTLFYQFFGSVSIYRRAIDKKKVLKSLQFELRCTGCPEVADPVGSISCSHCYYDQMNLFDDPVYQNSVKPYMWICAAILPSAYIIGLLFSLHTHADMVWKSSTSLAKPATAPHPRVFPITIIHPSQTEAHEQTPLNAPDTHIVQGILFV